ncbi:MAG: hypothetical protein RLZZ299_3136 [Pseudomonadota bacterium]
MRLAGLTVVLVACNDAQLTTKNSAPEVTVLTPGDEGVYREGAPFRLCAQVQDEDALEDLVVILQASRDGALWSGRGVPGSCETGNAGFDVTLRGGAQTLSLVAVDTRGASGEDAVSLLPLRDEAPTCTLDVPADGDVVRSDTPLAVVARAQDPDDDAGSLRAVLASDVAGGLWEGAPDSGGSLAIPDVTLAPGPHLLTLTVTDPLGRTDICGARILVEGCFDDDADGILSCEGDCDDREPAVFPGGVEVPDGLDNDCDGVRDDGTVLHDDDRDGLNELDGDCDDGDPDRRAGNAERWYDGIDQDCDGRDDDRDMDGFPRADDCDDGDPARNPAETEAWYDGADQDCDGFDDDQDRDGHPFVEDCDDEDATRYPGAGEIWYDGVLQDCDRTQDSDQDGDGHPSTLAGGDDCDDQDDAVHPGAADPWYDGVDQDCDANDGDADRDGYAVAVDCDDTRADVNPGADEIWYDGTDQDCDGADDDDADFDGHASSAHGGDDCDDADPAVHPGMPDAWYDGIDANCDGADDLDADADGHRAVAAGGDDCDDARADVNPAAAEIWYDGTDQDCDANDQDADLDGYGVEVDCDDARSDVNPGADEIWYDGTDQDCDEADDDDADFDGHASDAHGGDDCDDADPAVHPGASDAWYDGVDANCDRADDLDADADGHRAEPAGGDDCDDTRPEVNPAATETWYDGVDQDCDGRDDDRDSDGYPVSVDCADLDPARNPGAAETWYDGVDQDCDGNDEDQDRDGFVLADDCDDTNGSVNPASPEAWYDSIDDDCDGNTHDQDGDGYVLADDCDDTDPTIHPGSVETRNALDDDCDEACDENLVGVGDLVISEFMRNPLGSEAQPRDAEWFELYNPTDTDIRLCGVAPGNPDAWAFVDNVGDWALQRGESVLVPAHGYAVLAQGWDLGVSGGGVTADAVYDHDLEFANTADELNVWHGGVLVDRVSWNGGTGWTADTRPPAYGTNYEGYAESLRPDRLTAAANDTMTNWCRGAQKGEDANGNGALDPGEDLDTNGILAPGGTPGAPNVCVP